MIKKYFNKTISSFLIIILIYGLFPSFIFAQPSLGEIKGFNKSVFDSHFSRADREINPERWLTEAKNGISQAVNAWELIALNIYDDPLQLNDAKNKIENWSNEELEKRFSQWLLGRFFGSAAEDAVVNLSQKLEKIQTNFSWHLDVEGNILFDTKTGDPMIVRLNEDGREFSNDLLSWRNETDNHIKAVSTSFEKNLIYLFPELLAYIPAEMRESMGRILSETLITMNDSIKREFNNIAAREERIFTSRRTRDIWSLRKKSDNEAARLFTEKLISETEAACNNGIEELNVRIEQADAGIGDLSLLGEEWLTLYKEQFDRGLKAWEEAEERFFIRRIEWEQETFKMFSEGEEIWLSAFKQLEDQRQKWELSAKELFSAGEALFINISEEFKKNIADAKKEFELNKEMRIGEGTTRVKALVDMYLISASAATSTKENILFWQQQYSGDKAESGEYKDISDSDFSNWIEDEMNKLWKEAEKNFLSELNSFSEFISNNYDSTLQRIRYVLKNNVSITEQIAIAKEIGYSYLSRNKFDALAEMNNLLPFYRSYTAKAYETRDMILKNYAELLGTGILKDFLSPDASSEDFCLDEYQIALVRANALVLYWERKTDIAQAVMSYAEELTAGRMTEAESIRAWEEARLSYNESLAVYEKELKKLNEAGTNIKEQQELLNNLTLIMKMEEENLIKLQSDYSALITISLIDRKNFYRIELNNKYNFLTNQYKEFYKSGSNAIYKNVLDYGMAWANLEQKEIAQNILYILINGDGNNILSVAELEESNLEIDFLLRLAAINLFADNLNGQLRAYDSDFSGADWYEKVKGINLSDKEKNALFGENLLNRLTEDYKNSSKILLDKRVDFELTLLFDFLDINKNLELTNDEYVFTELIKNCIVDTETASYIYEILNDLKVRIAQGLSYYTDDSDENIFISYFVSGDSFFLGSEQYLSQYFNENNFCYNLLDLYSDYAFYSSFNQKETWKNSCDSLSVLMNKYGINSEAAIILPDIYTITKAIFSMSGDFVNNTAKFLLEFEDCFSVIPKWLEYEINNWKNSLIEFVTVYAHYNNVKTVNTIDALYQEYEKLQTQYNTLINYSYSLNFISEYEAEAINNDFNKIMDNKNSLDCLLMITDACESLKKNEYLSENDLHWRQYLNSENIDTNYPIVASALTWKEGIYEDAFYKAIYFSNRTNDSFKLFSQNNQSNFYANSNYYFNLYENALSAVDLQFNTLRYLYEDLANAARSYDISKLNTEDVSIVLEKCEQELANQKEKYNELKNNYFLEVEKFITYGSLYDDQYRVLNKTLQSSNEKQLEYEKQDAIKRWASTAYLNTDTINLESSKEKLKRAKTVLEVLSDLYTEEKSRSYENKEYASLYSAYEQSFKKRIMLNEAMNALSSTIALEKMNNDKIFSEYQRSLYQLGYIDQNFEYNFSNESSSWNIKDIITVKNGRLVFSRDESMKLYGMDASKANDLISFFNTKNTQSGEFHSISNYEESLRSLSERMTGYFSNSEKYKQWSLARDYLISSLINANKDLLFLEECFSGLGEMTKENGSFASLSTQSGVFDRTKSLYSAVSGNKLFTDSENIFRNAWDSLTSNEKSDLEYYIILTLSGYGNDYLKGFSKMYTLDVYELAYNYTNKYYNEARSQASKWYNFLWQWAWNDMKGINDSTLNRITSPIEITRNEVKNWINGINGNLSSIKDYSTAYIESCKRLDFLEGKESDKLKIVWKDINDSLLSTNKINLDDIKEIKNYWEIMQKNSNEEYDSVSKALAALVYWAKDAENNSKSEIENFWNAKQYEHNQNENNYLTVVNAYIDGKASINDLKAEINKTYGKNALSWKNHLNNMHTVLFNNLSEYLNININMLADFNIIGNEIVLLAEDTLEKKYNTEFSAREIEWQQILKEITDKYNEWQASAAQILESGRMDWTIGLQKMEDSYRQWNINFKNEYERINNEWNEFYLAGLEDKERWLEQAANAANQASADSFLSLIGTEGERLSRFLDAREPFGIRDAAPAAQTLMSELLQSSGIVNMANAFSSLNSISSSISVNVKRGMSGTTWDANLVKTAAADLAKQTNAEIANNESRILAFNARLNAEEIVKSLSEMVENSNKGFRENMDNHFIIKGLWRKSGNNYVKDIIKGSTLFTPVITQTVYISGYVNYNLEPITLKTNLDENSIAHMDSIAIRELLNNIMTEVETISEEIFGKDNNKISVMNDNGEEREQSPGKFGAHIGYSPTVKPQDEMGSEKDEMFYDQGAGELGRLISEYIYWHVVDSKGSYELTLAPWDKRMWDDDGSWFTAPSLRTIGTIAGSIAAGIISCGSGFAMLALSIGVGTASDLVFGSLDLAMGYKSIDEVAFNVGKSLVTNTVAGLCGGVFKGMTTAVMKNVSGTLNTVIAQTMMTGVQTFTTGFATNLISGVTYDSENGFGYSGEIVRAGFNNMLTNTLVSMTSSLVSSSMHATNTGYHINKLFGFNETNQIDVSKLNNLVGSIAGQGVNYALGNDFSLNILNLNLLSDGKYQGGLLELNIGRNGVKMNFGTGGANVSIDNIISSVRGAMVWNTNNKISNYINNKDNKFDSAVALRAQYGYGDTVQKDQLWGILKGDIKIITDSEGKNAAESTREDGKKVINLTGYKQGMSAEDQFRLAAILGHEAYRDGYVTGETDASGNIVTSSSSFNELKTASIAKLAMTNRINAEHEWFYQYNQDFDLENAFLLYAKETGDYSMYDEYLELTYNNDKDYFWIRTETNNNFQNEDGYWNIPLFDASSRDSVNEINEERKLAAFERYEAEQLEKGEEVKLWEDFYKDKDLLIENGYKEMDFISLHNYGCRFMTVKYSLERLTGKNINAEQLHNLIKEDDLYSKGSILTNQNIADILTRYSDGYFNVTSVFADKPTVEQIYEFTQSENMYLACLQVPNGQGGAHYVMLSEIEFSLNSVNGLYDVYVSVANPWNSKGVLGKKSYTDKEILSWDIFLVTPTRLNYNVNNNLTQRQSTVSTVNIGEYSYQTLMNGIKR
ncbi:MAG: hypothetical protein FWB86_00700 [Treponema sp.]|nr:hypothetical protein [Treponema sp.]MCL2250614.1 hypothetical protein [Treponema sp.]